MDLPTDLFNFNLTVQVIPEYPSVTFSQIKICSVVPIASGENIPCPNCLNQGISTYSATDYTWTLSSLMNLAVRNQPTDLANANQMKYLF